MSHTLRVKPRDADRVRLVQITDTHIARDPGPTDFEGVDTAATLAAVLAAVDALPDAPDCMVLTGDLVDIPSPEAYGRLRALLRGRRYPVVCLAGNHDDPVMMDQLLNAGALSTSRVLDFDSWRVLMLKDWLVGSDGGRFAPNELDFLHRELTAAGKVPVLICLHHQPVPIGSPWMDAMGLDNAAELFAVTDSFNMVRAMAWGHIHQEFSTERRGIALWGTPSTCVQFLPGAGEYRVDTLAPGFRTFELQPGGALTSRVIRI